MSKGIEVFIEKGRRVIRGLGYYETREVRDLRELVKESARIYGSAPGFKFKDRAGNIICRTYRDLDKDIDCLGTALISLGLKGSRIAIISENRYEWGVSYLAVVNGTGTVVPLDKYLPKNEVENLVERGKVEAIFYSPAFHDMMMEIAKTNNYLKYFICMEKLPEITEKGDKVLSFPDLIEKGKHLLESGDKCFIDAPIDRDGMSILLFTSGTTSISKGVMLSHSNIVANILGVASVIKLKPNDVHLSLLPLHHTFENTIGLLFMVYSGACIAYSEGIKHVAQNLKEYDVTLLVAVPAILEFMYNRLQEGIEKSGKTKQFALLVKISEFLRSIGIDMRRKIFSSVLEKIGPGLRLAVSGAAPLDPKVIEGFDKIGLKLIQGYGLTETSPVVSTNNDFVNKPGTIGYPLRGIEVTIDSPDENGMGEIMVRGKNVMLGYYEDPMATAEAIDADGWFRTGDLGSIDQGGFIRITGRAKSMIVFTNGKKAFPEEYEVLLNNIPGVKESFVWGNKAPDGDIQICAELVVDMERLMDEKGSLPSENELADTFGKAIRDINKTLPQYKTIRYFIMTREDLVKTTTLKIKRPVEMEKIMGALNKAGIDMRKASGKFLETLN